MNLQIHKKHPWSDLLLEFYDFVEESRDFLKTHPKNKISSELISKLESKIEVIKESSSGRQYKESKFDSAIYRDIEVLLVLRELLVKYTDVELNSFKKIIEIEFQGLECDLNPKTMLLASLPGVIFLGLGLIATWSAIWANYFDLNMVGAFFPCVSRCSSDSSSSSITMIFVVSNNIESPIPAAKPPTCAKYATPPPPWTRPKMSKASHKSIIQYPEMLNVRGRRKII